MILNHVVPGDLPAAAMVAAIESAAPAPAQLTTLLGLDLEATIVKGSVLLKPDNSDILAKVVTTDVVTCAGTVHVVERVLVPGEIAKDSITPAAEPSTPSAAVQQRPTSAAYSVTGVSGMLVVVAVALHMLL
ncbi:MAG: hypothetical protein HC767_13950 [Akkermansiaceae bacterium]|nr:hypothetical protein [Akkermansiaceae bacterium]